jgi:hypothetical protein
MTGRRLIRFWERSAAGRSGRASGSPNRLALSADMPLTWADCALDHYRGCPSPSCVRAREGAGK